VEVQLGESADDDTALQFGEWRYLRFFIKIHPGFGFDAATGSLAGASRDFLAAQVWQRSSNAFEGRPSVSPAFSINIATTKPAMEAPLNHAPLDCPPNQQCVWAEFRYKNICNYGTCWDGYTKGGTFHTELIVKDQWVGFIIGMKPVHVPVLPWDPTARGAILIWRLAGTTAALNVGPALTETTAVNYPYGESAYKFYWGYRPETEFAQDQAGLTDRFDVRVGMYRNEGSACSTSGCPALYNDTVFMDSIKLTNDQTCLPGLGLGGC
jgi:hypothetical protein